jgi:hypothetical protein
MNRKEWCFLEIGGIISIGEILWLMIAGLHVANSLLHPMISCRSSRSCQRKEEKGWCRKDAREDGAVKLDKDPR